MRTDPSPRSGTEMVLQIRAAREEFAEDLRREREWLDFKTGQGPMPYPVVDRSRDWRDKRQLCPVWPLLR